MLGQGQGQGHVDHHENDHDHLSSLLWVQASGVERNWELSL